MGDIHITSLTTLRTFLSSSLLKPQQPFKSLKETTLATSAQKKINQIKNEKKKIKRTNVTLSQVVRENFLQKNKDHLNIEQLRDLGETTLKISGKKKKKTKKKNKQTSNPIKRTQQQQREGYRNSPY